MFMKENWVIFSILAAISFSVMVLVFKKLLLLKINQIVLNWAIFGLVFIGFSFLLLITKTPVKISWWMFLLLIIAAIFSLIGNYYQVQAFNSSPNPGYASTIISLQLIFISVLAVFIFNTQFNWVKFLGIAVVIFGSFLIAK
jgi:drug/metabolite transporter (DMT)-like permease